MAQTAGVAPTGGYQSQSGNVYSGNQSRAYDQAPTGFGAGSQDRNQVGAGLGGAPTDAGAPANTPYNRKGHHQCGPDTKSTDAGYGQAQPGYEHFGCGPNHNTAFVSSPEPVSPARFHQPGSGVDASTKPFPVPVPPPGAVSGSTPVTGSGYNDQPSSGNAGYGGQGLDQQTTFDGGAVSGNTPVTGSGYNDQPSSGNAEYGGQGLDQQTPISGGVAQTGAGGYDADFSSTIDNSAASDETTTGYNQPQQTRDNPSGVGPIDPSTAEQTQFGADQSGYSADQGVVDQRQQVGPTDTDYNTTGAANGQTQNTTSYDPTEQQTQGGNPTAQQTQFGADQSGYSADQEGGDQSLQTGPTDLDYNTTATGSGQAQNIHGNDGPSNMRQDDLTQGVSPAQTGTAGYEQTGTAHQSQPEPDSKLDATKYDATSGSPAGGGAAFAAPGNDYTPAPTGYTGTANEESPATIDNATAADTTTSPNSDDATAQDTTTPPRKGLISKFMEKLTPSSVKQSS